MRLIDADKLKEELIVLFNLYDEETPTDYVLNELERAPTIEERPHGEWIVSMANTRCSNCGYNGKTVEETNFCPNCGAKMRREGEAKQANDRQVTGKLNSETEYKAKAKELEDAIAKCERAEKEFKNRTCKFRSQINCDFCAFHSECEERWKEGDEK